MNLTVLFMPLSLKSGERGAGEGDAPCRGAQDAWVLNPGRFPAETGVSRS